MTDVLSVFLIFSVVFGSYVQIIFAYTDTNQLDIKAAFWYAITFYKENQDKLNNFGLILGVVVISILVLPGSIVAILTYAIIKLGEIFWMGFRYLFRKKS